MMSSNGSISETSAGYSADVRLMLVLNGRRLPLAQTGPDDVILPEAAVIPAGPAELLAVIDGRERRWRVRLAGTDTPARVVPMTIEQ
jgi:hypothetical protein